MQNFADYIEDFFRDEPDNATLYRYKRQLLDQMTTRANEIAYTGLQDEHVLNDLVISAFPDLKADYKAFVRAERKQRYEKNRSRFMIFGTFGCALLLVLIFLSIGFTTSIWSPTWLIIADGMLLWTMFLLSVFVQRLTEKRRLYQPIARVLLALDVMCGAVATFLFFLSFLHFEKAWVILLIGVIGIFIADGIYACATEQKLRIFNYLIYIPATAPMLYVVLCALDVMPWHPGWLLMPASVLVDILLILGKLVKRAKYKYKPEVQ